MPHHTKIQDNPFSVAKYEGLHLWIDRSGSVLDSEHEATFVQMCLIAMDEGLPLSMTCFSHELGQTRRILDGNRFLSGETAEEKEACLRKLFAEVMGKESVTGGTDFALIWAGAKNEPTALHVVSTDFAWAPNPSDEARQPDNVGYVPIVSENFNTRDVIADYQRSFLKNMREWKNTQVVIGKTARDLVGTMWSRVI